MLLVKDSMTREIVTLAPDETVGTALALCRERRIRHLPVLTEGRLVGIVSDRDLRSATPAFGDQARAAALQEILVEDVMVSDVVSALPDDPIEQAANTMREHKIGCLPVVESGELVGIITSSDVMSALVYLVGANEPGSRMEIAVPDSPGSLAETIPTSLPSVRTGRCLMRLSLHRASAVPTVSSGASVTISRVIESLTRSIK